MSTVPQRLLTPQEYLEREVRAGTRSEFYQGEIFAMSGGSWWHNLIKDNLVGEIRIQLKGGKCRVVSSDQRVKIDASGLYTYPDMLILCEPPQFEDDVYDSLLNPRIIFEVLSDSTEKYDRGRKFAHYRQIPSLKEYILCAQDQPLIERNVRQEDDTWLLTVFDDLSQTFTLGSLPVSVPMAEIYSGVEFHEDTSPT
jgi:Uma2 family endonuclease